MQPCVAAACFTCVFILFLMGGGDSSDDVLSVVMVSHLLQLCREDDAAGPVRTPRAFLTPRSYPRRQNLANGLALGRKTLTSS